MADGEKIDVVKAVTAPFTGLFWVKCIMFGFGIGFLLFVGYCIYNTLHPKPTQTQNATTTIQAQSGSNIHLDAPTQTQTSKASHLSIGPFVGGSSDGDVFGGVVLLYNF